MKSKNLKERAVFQKKQLQQNDIGESVISYAEIATKYVHIEPAELENQEEESITLTNERFKIELRYSPALDAAIKNDDVVLIDGIQYSIVSRIDRFNRRDMAYIIVNYD